MTREELLEHQAKERAFADTPIGMAFIRFKLAHSRYWQADSQESISDRRLMELDKASGDAERELRSQIDLLLNRCPA